MTFTIAAPGTTANPVTAGTFTQTDLDFQFSGTITGTAVSVLSYSINLDNATVENDPAFTNATITIETDGSYVMSLPIDVELLVPLTLQGFGTEDVPLSVTGTAVVTGVIPEPGSLMLIAAGVAVIGSRRSRHG